MAHVCKEWSVVRVDGRCKSHRVMECHSRLGSVGVDVGRSVKHCCKDEIVKVLQKILFRRSIAFRNSLSKERPSWIEAE